MSIVQILQSLVLVFLLANFEVESLTNCEFLEMDSNDISLSTCLILADTVASNACSGSATMQLYWFDGEWTLIPGDGQFYLTTNEDIEGTQSWQTKGSGDFIEVSVECVSACCTASPTSSPSIHPTDVGDLSCGNFEDENSVCDSVSTPVDLSGSDFSTDCLDNDNCNNEANKLVCIEACESQLVDGCCSFQAGSHICEFYENVSEINPSMDTTVWAVFCSETPMPSSKPTVAPTTPIPTESPTFSPTQVPTASPTLSPTSNHTWENSTLEPTPTPNEELTPVPTYLPNRTLSYDIDSGEYWQAELTLASIADGSSVKELLRTLLNDSGIPFLDLQSGNITNVSWEVIVKTVDSTTAEHIADLAQNSGRAELTPYGEGSSWVSLTGPLWECSSFSQRDQWTNEISWCAVAVNAVSINSPDHYLTSYTLLTSESEGVRFALDFTAVKNTSVVSLGLIVSPSASYAKINVLWTEVDGDTLLLSDKLSGNTTEAAFHDTEIAVEGGKNYRLEFQIQSTTDDYGITFTNNPNGTGAFSVSDIFTDVSYWQLNDSNWMATNGGPALTVVLCDDLCLLATSEVSARSRSLPWYTLEGQSWYYIAGFCGLLVLCCMGIAVGHYCMFGTPERNNINLSLGAKRYNQLSMGDNEIVDDFQDLPGVDDPKRVLHSTEEVKMKELQGEAVVKGFGDVISYTPHDKGLLRRQSQEEMKRQTQSWDNVEEKRQELDPRRVENLMEKPSPPLNDQLGYNVPAEQAGKTAETQNPNLQLVPEQAVVPPALLPVPPVQSTVQREIVTVQEDAPRRHRRPKKKKRDGRRRRRRHVSAR